MIDGLIKHLPHLIMILRLPEDPHEFGDGGFQGHIVGLDKTEGVFDLLADLVDGHVAAFLSDLGGHDNDFSHRDPFFDGAVEIAGFIGRKTADTEGFDDDCVVMLCHIVEEAGVHGRDQL